MTTIKRIRTGDTVKMISGANKGTTGKVVKVMTKTRTILVEGIGNRHRNVKPSQLNPRGGHKDIHVATPIHKVALVVDEKTSATSRVGLTRNADGTAMRTAIQKNNKEIK